MAFDYLDSDSDSSYNEGPPLDASTTATSMMNLRKTQRLRRPVRYRDDLEPLDPGRPIFVHQDPVFNMDRARFVQWRTLELNEPSPGEVLYKEWQAQGEPRDAFGAPIVPSHSSQVQQAPESPRPTVAHLQRQSTVARHDLTQPVVGSVEYKDEFDKAFEANLAMFELEDDDDEPLMTRPDPSTEYQDWSALGHNVQWAMIYDLAHDHEDGIIAAANLLGLNLDEVINFVNLYMREKALWDDYTYQEEPTYTSDGLFELDGAQDEAKQPATEAEVDHLMRDSEPGQQYLGDEATRTVELVTDSFSREDIGSGRSYLTFVGLQAHADRFGEWFGKGTMFRDIPGIFDANNELIFSAEDAEKALYNGNEFAWPGPTPKFERGPAQNEFLMEALPQDPKQAEDPSYLPWQHFQAISDQHNGPPIGPPETNERLLGNVPDGMFGGLRNVEPDEAPAPVGLFVNVKSKKGGGGPTRKGSAVGISSSVDGLENNEPRQMGERAHRGMGRDFGNDHARLFNTSSAMHPPSEMYQFNRSITPYFLEEQRLGIRESFLRKRLRSPCTPPFVQPSLSSQPRGGLEQSADNTAAAFSSLGHTGGHVSSRSQVLQARMDDHSSATTHNTAPLPIETSLKPNDPELAEGETHDYSVTASPAPDRTVNENAKSVEQNPEDSERFSENGIEVDTFPKCYSCFTVRARCLGGRPCSSCTRRNRKCRAVTKADLDAFPERAQRVLKDKAKAHSKEAQAAGPSMAPGNVSTPSPVVSAPAASKAVVKRKQSAMTGDLPSDKVDTDVDDFPPEKDDPKDGDYVSTPKKKKLQKKGGTPVGKEQTLRQAKSGVPTSPAPTATTSAAPTSQTPTPTKGRGQYRKKGGTSTPKRNGPAVAATGTPTPESAEKASAGRVCTSGSRYVDTSFAPMVSSAHQATPGFSPDTLSRSSAGLYDTAPRAVPPWGAQSMPLELDHPAPARAGVMSAENELPGGGESPTTASGLSLSMAQEMLPLTTDRTSLGAQTDRPRSLSSNSGTTVSMDFLPLPARYLSTYRDPSTLGGLGQSSSGQQGMLGFSPDSSACKVPMDSPTASRRRQPVSSYNNGAQSSGARASPIMGLIQGSTTPSELVSPYAMSRQQRPFYRPVPEVQKAPSHPGPRHIASVMPGGVHGPRSEYMQPGLQYFSSYPVSQEDHEVPAHPANHQWDSPMYPGQQPAQKKSRPPPSPVAPPRQARSWKELAHNQWVTETQESQAETANFSTEPTFGGDGLFEDISSSEFTNLFERTEPEP